MSPETSTVLSGGALAVIVIDRVLNFLRQKPTNGNGKDHAILVTKLEEVLKDTAAIRAHNHTIINHLAGLQPSLALLIGRLGEHR